MIGHWNLIKSVQGCEKINTCILQEMRADLAHLAHRCCDIDKYRVETCCVIGNV